MKFFVELEQFDHCYNILVDMVEIGYYQNHFLISFTCQPHNVLTSKASLTSPLCSWNEISWALFDSSKIMEKGWYLLLYRLKRMYWNVERDIVRIGQNMQKSKACVEAVSSISNVPMVSSKKECLFWMLKPEKYIHMYFTYQF